MEYTGIERRAEIRLQDHTNVLLICKQEEKIDKIFDSIHRTENVVEKLDIKLCTTFDKIDMRINNTLEKMGVHVEDSIYWRRFIVGVAISLILSIVGGCIALFSLSYNLGQYTRQIIVNTDRLNIIESEHKELRGASKE